MCTYVYSVFFYLCSVLSDFILFFFKQKTAYEMRISDWSSDVCSSDLIAQVPAAQNLPIRPFGGIGEIMPRIGRIIALGAQVAVIGEIGRASCRERVCQYV